MPSLALPGLSLHYETRGLAGAPLLMVAGLASDVMSWSTVAMPLASRYRTIAVDNRGVGRTRPQDAPSSIDAMADDCVALLDHLGVARANVMGHSMGGFVAQRVALRHPGRVHRLVLAATAAAPGAANVARFGDLAAGLEAGEPPAAWFARMFDMIFTRRFLSTPESVDAALGWALDYPFPQSAAGFRRQCDAMAAFDGTDDAASIAIPVLVLAGREDRLFPPDACAAFAARLPRAELCVLDGAAHALHTEQPMAFVDAVASFLD